MGANRAFSPPCFQPPHPLPYDFSFFAPDDWLAIRQACKRGKNKERAHIRAGVLLRARMHALYNTRANNYPPTIQTDNLPNRPKRTPTRTKDDMTARRRGKK